MPDTTPSATQTSGDACQEEGWRPDLATLRARLDTIDDQIHDLLMDRARVVEGVARSGKAAAFRPGREAAILRRLLARHTGALPAHTLVRMWREMLAGTTGMQTSVTIAVFDSPAEGLAANGALTAIAREHFGFLTPILAHDSLNATLAAVRAGTVTAAVVPFPADTAAWAAAWRALTEAEPRLYVIARLPFWEARPAHVPDAGALVIATASPDPSGHDRSFLVLPETPDRACLTHVLLEDAGLTLRAAHGRVAEVEGMVTDDDPRLPNAIRLGGYAIPVAGDAP